METTIAAELKWCASLSRHTLNWIVSNTTHNLFVEIHHVNAITGTCYCVALRDHDLRTTAYVWIDGETNFSAIDKKLAAAVTQWNTISRSRSITNAMGARWGLA